MLFQMVSGVLTPYHSLLQMIVEPEQRVADFAKAGSDIISVHCEQGSTIHLDRVVNQVGLRVVNSRMCGPRCEVVRPRMAVVAM